MEISMSGLPDLKQGEKVTGMEIVGSYIKVRTMQKSGDHVRDITWRTYVLNDRSRLMAVLTE